MEFFDRFSSNTCAGSANQSVFSSPEVTTGRVFYKIQAGGAFSYSFLFSNILDSTFANGAVSRKNLICDGWTLHRAAVAVCSKEFSNGDRIDFPSLTFTPLTFEGKTEKKVAPGEFFATDPILLAVCAEEYLCLELSFSGKLLPNHHELNIPSFVLMEGEWVRSVKLPCPGMIGCDRPVKARIGFLGDSITQGLGTPVNSYAHWNALLSQKIGTDYAFWNLGIGYGRAEDLASGGAWFFKAKQNDLVVVCYGVNDIMQGATAQQLIARLDRIVTLLTATGMRVVLQTIPPFNYDPTKRVVWEQANAYLREEAAKRVFCLFDVCTYLQQSADEPHLAKYGGHPNQEGCVVWAEALYEALMRHGCLDGLSRREEQ